MITLLLTDCFVLKDAYSEIERCDIRIKEGRIAEIGKNLRPEPGEIIYELKEKLIAPAFYNTHTHSAMTLFRGISDDDPFDVWLFEKLLPLEEKITSKMVYYGTLLAMMEMVKNGIAGFVDMYFFIDDIAKAVEDFGMRALVTRGLVDENGEDDGRLKENIEVLKKWKGRSNRINVGFGPHAPYTCSEEYLKRISQIAKVENATVTIHIYEAPWEREKYDAKKIINIFKGLKLIIAHAVQFKEDELPYLKDENIFVSHNPSSNLKLGNGIAPIPEMLKNGINVTLGTDGPASNNSLNIKHEMRLASLLQKMKNPTFMKVEEALYMATRAGAIAMDVDGGVLTKGKVADLVVYDLKNPECLPFENVKSHLVHSECPVWATMVDGEWIYFDGEFKTVDKDEIIRRFKCCVKDLLEG